MCLLCIQVVFGLKINLVEPKLVNLGEGREAINLATFTRYKMGNLPMKYLGLPLGAKFKGVSTWEPVVSHAKSHLIGWKRGLLLKDGKLTLIKNVMENIPI